MTIVTSLSVAMTYLHTTYHWNVHAQQGLILRNLVLVLALKSLLCYFDLWGNKYYVASSKLHDNIFRVAQLNFSAFRVFFWGGGGASFL